MIDWFPRGILIPLLVMMAAGALAAEVAAPTPAQAMPESTPETAAPEADVEVSADPTPMDVDPVTRRRAEEAMAEFVRAGAVAMDADPQVLDQLSAAETALDEAESALAGGDAQIAGARFLVAGAALRGLPSAQRPLVAERLRRSMRRLDSLSRLLLDSAAIGVPAVPDSP